MGMGLDLSSLAGCFESFCGFLLSLGCPDCCPDGPPAAFACALLACFSACFCFFNSAGESFFGSDDSGLEVEASPLVVAGAGAGEGCAGVVGVAATSATGFEGSDMIVCLSTSLLHA